MSIFNVPSVNGGPVLADDAAVDAVAAIPGLSVFLDPAAGWFDGLPGAITAWEDRVNSYKWAPKSVAPTQSDTGLGGQPALVMGAGALNSNGQTVSPAGVEMWPIGKDYTIAFAFKSTDTGGIRSLLGSGGPSNNAKIGLNGSSGAIFVAHQQTALVTAAGTWNDGNPHFVVASYDFTAKQLVLRIDGVQRATSAVATEIINSADNMRMVIGGEQAVNPGGTTSAINTSLGRIAVVSGVALHKPQYAANLTALEALRTPYGIA